MTSVIVSPCFFLCRIGFVYDAYILRAQTTSQQMLALKSRGSGEFMLEMCFAAAVPMIISSVAVEWRRVYPRVLRFWANWALRRRRPTFVRTIEYEEASRVCFRRNGGVPGILLIMSAY